MRQIGLTLVVALCGCAPVTSGLPLDAGAAARSIVARTTTPIQHVVIVVQENQSFVHVFAGYPGADAPTMGKMYGGQQVALTPVGFNTVDVEHSYGESIADVDGGKMDGFSQNVAYSGGGEVGNVAVSYLRRNLVAPYWSMARQYTLADRMFPTQHGPSWTAHIDLIAGTTSISPASALVDFPSSSPYDCWAPAGTVTQTIGRGGFGTGPFPCLTQFRTMADTLDAANVSWRFYAPPISGDTGCESCGYTWSAFGEISNVRNGPDWGKVVSPSPRVLSDIANGELAGVTWVIPDEAYSDHADVNATAEGPSWVSAVVNAIGRSKFWKSTAIVVVWDEWGGFYDDAVPPRLDYRGLGIRVPCLIVSPYAKRNHVSHTQYEFGSVLRFVEQVFGLPVLGTRAAGYTDGRANSILDSFDFSQMPAAFKTIAAPYPPSTFLKAAPSGKPPDDE